MHYCSGFECLMILWLILTTTLNLVHSSFSSPMMQSKHGFNPADEHKKKHSNNNNNKNGKSSSGNDDEASLVTKARDVFTRVPTLWALFCEILACQGLSTLLNVLCVTKVSEVISDDTERAGWMGKVRIYILLSTQLHLHDLTHLILLPKSSLH